MYNILLLLLIIIILLIFTYSKNNYEHFTSINIPLNQFPFIGAHNAITGSIDNNINNLYLDTLIKFNESIPIMKTQSLSLIKLYEKGIRFFDLRIDLEKNFKSLFSNKNNVWFHHTVPLINMDNSRDLIELINIAILEKTLIVLYFSHYTINNENDIINLINIYFNKNNFINNFTLINTDIKNNLSTTIQSFLNKNIYIVGIVNGKTKYIQDNYDQNISCFIDSKTCINNIPKSIDESKNNLWIKLKEYMDNSNNNYQNHINNIKNDKSMYITQVFFQTPTDIINILNLLYYTNFNKDSLLKLNNELDLNYKIANYIKDNNLKSNVFLFDSIKDDNTIPLLKQYIESQINYSYHFL